MDEEWAIGVLEWWVVTASRARGTSYNSITRENTTYAFIRPGTDSFNQLKAREDQTRRIIARVLGHKTLPAILDRKSSNDAYWVNDGIDLATYALGRLRTDAETRAKLGSNAPSMSADALHPLIWGAASKHWDVGHYSAAVQRAATMLNAEVQDRVIRHDVSDNELMKQTFSIENPQEGKPRLRWPGLDDDLTVKAMRVGILQLAQGVFSAIRNPATHSTDDMQRQEALEQLATLSILARWIDRCDLVTVEGHFSED